MNKQATREARREYTQYLSYRVQFFDDQAGHYKPELICVNILTTSNSTSPHVVQMFAQIILSLYWLIRELYSYQKFSQECHCRTCLMPEDYTAISTRTALPSCSSPNELMKLLGVIRPKVEELSIPGRKPPETGARYGIFPGTLFSVFPTQGVCTNTYKYDGL